jgi:hypothetical protein
MLSGSEAWDCLWGKSSNDCCSQSSSGLSIIVVDGHDKEEEQRSSKEEKVGDVRRGDEELGREIGTVPS